MTSLGTRGVRSVRNDLTLKSKKDREARASALGSRAPRQKRRSLEHDRPHAEPPPSSHSCDALRRRDRARQQRGSRVPAHGRRRLPRPPRARHAARGGEGRIARTHPAEVGAPRQPAPSEHRATRCRRSGREARRTSPWRSNIWRPTRAHRPPACLPDLPQGFSAQVAGRFRDSEGVAYVLTRIYCRVEAVAGSALSPASRLDESLSYWASSWAVVDSSGGLRPAGHRMA